MILATKGSNDLNMLLKAQVVKIRAELDVPNSMPKIKKQVGEISERLEKANKRVKIKVELDTTIKNLNKQFSELQTKISTSKTAKPIKLQVQIDVAGSAKAIKEQLKDVYKTVEQFNKQYAQQIKKMQQQAQQAGQKVTQSSTGAIPQTSPIGGFDYKLYVQQVKDAERLMRTTFGKNGNFASFEMRDAQGNLNGFIAQLEKANGVVQKIKYQWNAEAGQFTPINQQTVNTMQKHLQKAEQGLKSLQAEMFKLGDGAGKDNLLRQYSELEKRISNGTLTQNAVKDLQRMIKEEQVLQQQLDKSNKEYLEREKLIREIRNARNTHMRADTQFDIKPYNDMIKAVKAGTKSVAEQRLEYQKLEDVHKKEIKTQKEVIANTKKRMQYLQQLRNIERNTVSSDETSQRLIREIRLMAQRAKSAQEWIDVQRKMNLLNTSNNNEKDLQRITLLQDKVNKKVVEYAQLTNKSDAEVRRLLQSVQLTASRGYKDLERMFYSWNRQIDQVRANNRAMANESKTLMSGMNSSSNGVSFTQLRDAINYGDVNKIQQYVERLYGARVETVKVVQAKDALGRAVDRMQIKMAGAGKTVRTYTVDLDRANSVLRQTAQGTDYNANRNLGVIEQLKVALARVPVWMTAMTAFYGTINGFKAMAKEILEVDKALTELRRVADAGINIEHIFRGAVDLSKELGNNIHDVMQTVNDFARTFGQFNERQLLAITRTATLMSNVSELTAIEAGESLIGTMNAFNIEAEESLRIVDAFNEVDNNFAISTKQLAEGMSKGASTAKTFGVEMEETVGHITAIGAVTMESGKVIGNSLKTIYSRITTIDDAKDILEGVGVALYDIQGNVLPVNDILADLASKWGTLSDSQRQNIAVTVAGRYQLSRFLALMNNWQTAVDATATAYTSQGSAMRENDQYLKSFEARINQLKNSFTDLSLAVGDAVLSDGMMAVIEGLKDIATFATNVVKEVGMLPIAFGALFAVLNGFGVFKNIKTAIAGAVVQLGIFRTAMTTATASGAGALGGMVAGWRALTVAEAQASAGAKAFGWSLRGALISTGIGAILVGIGFAIEKLVSHFAKQKQIAEETEKANKALVDSYRNTEGGLDNLIKKHEELQEKVDSGAIKEGTEAYNDYLQINQQVADALPTMVKYVDSNGKAHLESADAMKEEVKIAEQLSLEYAKMEEIKFADDVQERVKSIKDLGKELEKLAKKREKLEKQHGTEQYYYYYGYGVDGQSYTIDNSKEIQQTKIEAVQAYQEIQKQVQGINLEIKETVLASLEADKVLKGLTDTQIGAIEAFVTQNEHILMETANQLKEGKITQEEFVTRITEQTNEMYEAGVAIGNIINDKSQELIENATVGMLDDVKIGEKTAEIKEDFDMLIKSLPTTFFKVESLDNVDDFKDRLNGVLEVANKVQGGAFDFDSLVGELQKQNFTLEEAQGMVISLGYQYDNAGIKAEALKMKEEGLTDGLQGYIDVAMEATDATKNLFGYESSELSALQSHIETLQGLKVIYGENASSQQAWKDSIEQVSWFLAVEEDQIEKNLGHYQTVVNLLPNLKLKYDDLGNAIGFDTEQLSENEKKIVENMIAKGQEGQIIDLLTGKVSTLTGETVKDTEAKNANTEASKKSEEALKAEEEATQALIDKFAILKGEMNTTNKSAYIETIRGQLDDLDGKITVTKDKVTGELKLVMADGTESTYLNTLQTQLDELGIKVGLTKDEAGNLKLVLNDGTGSQDLATIDQQAKDAKLAIDGTITSADILSQKKILPNDFSQIDFFALSQGLDSTFQKVDLLSEALKGTSENILSVEDRILEFQKKVDNIANTTDTILNNAQSFDAIRGSVEKLIETLLIAQEKMGGIFNGLHISDDVAKSIGDASTKIAGIGTASILANTETGKLALTLGLLSAVLASSSGIPEYVHQLGLLSHNLVLASQYGQNVVTTQAVLAQSFATVVSIVKSYNISIENAGAGVSVTYIQMANVIAIMTNVMIANYMKNAKSVGTMKSMISKTLQEVVTEFAQKGTLMVKVMDTVTNAMHREFKSGMDDIVETASGVPARIGKAIRDNMNSASSAMDEVAKDMVRRFKKELGIHSPSRVFEDLGGWVIKGLANGLTGEDLKSLGKDVFSDFGGGIFDSWDMIKAYISGDWSNVAGKIGNIGGGVQKWAGIATQALMMTGQYTPENLQKLLFQMTTESGGNPMAINLWDINAKRGIPSKGLMQVIDPTFRAYAHPQYNKNIYDPLSNILASIRYALARYGSLARAYRGVGYEVGGFIDKEHLAMVGEDDKREVVIPLEQHRARAVALWSQAGEELGLGDVIETIKPRRGRGGMGAMGGAFGASSGEGGGGEGGSGGTGSSGIMQESIYTGGVNADGGYLFNVSELQELTKPNYREREITSWKGTIATLEGRMQRMTQNSLAYRNALKEVIFYQNKILSNTKKELDATIKRNNEVNNRLKQLGNTSRHTEKQREEYNKLQQEYDSNLSKITQLKGEIESLTNDIRNKSVNIFTNLIDEVVDKYDEAIKKLQDKTDDIQFKIDVLALTNENDLETQLNLLAKKARTLQEEEQTTGNKRQDLEDKYNEAVKKYGAGSDQAKHVKDALDKAEEAWEDAVINALQAEKAIGDVRGQIADKGIDSLKKYYTNMKDMSTKAIEAERKALEKSHKSKMEMYDKEIEKINSVYDAKLKEMDKEKAQSEYQEQLDEKALKRTELMNKISLLSRDTTLEGRRRVDELKSELDSLNKEISDLQKQHADELLREQIEAQKQAQINAIEASKKTQTIEYDSKIEELDLEQENINKRYDDILNNERYWGEMKNNSIQGSFKQLTSELEAMSKHLMDLSQGNFDGITSGFIHLSDEVKKAYAELVALNVDNLVYTNGDILDQTYQAERAKYEAYMGSGTNFDWGTETTWSAPPPPAPPPPPPPPAPKPNPPANRYHTVKKGDTLWDLAKRYYGNPYKWTTIANANQNPDPRKLQIGRNLLIPFKTGGYTGDWAGDEGKMAILHKKELVLTKEQTSDILNTAKLMDKLKGVIPSVQRTNIASKLADSSNVSTSISYGDIHVTVENGDKKKAKDIASEILTGMKKKGR